MTLGDRFREAFRRHAAGVTVIAGLGPDGPVGLTASSVASVSADPPMVSFSVARTSGSGATLVGLAHLTIHVLDLGAQPVAEAFASHAGERFGGAWSRADDGTPVLGGVPAVLHVHPVRVVPAGQSWLVLAAVDDVELGAAGDPLVHHQRAYHSLTRTSADRGAA